MCIICIQYQENALTKYEAWRALREWVMSEAISIEHAAEVYDLLTKEEGVIYS